VHTANSGQLAIDLAYELRPDLVLMDVMMPGLDGPSTLMRMRQSVLLADIPVIFMTAKVLPAEISRFFNWVPSVSLSSRSTPSNSTLT
jgi:CheY-like chemotaxis protein